MAFVFASVFVNSIVFNILMTLLFLRATSFGLYYFAFSLYLGLYVFSIWMTGFKACATSHITQFNGCGIMEFVQLGKREDLSQIYAFL